MSTLDPYEYSRNTTILYIWAWERCKPSYESDYKKRMKKKNGAWLMFNFPMTKSSQQGKTAREKQYFQYWILRLVVFTRFRSNRDCLLKLYINQISKNSFLWALLGNTNRHWVYFIWLAEGVATILCCCAKLVFMLLTIGLWRRAGLLKLWVAASNGAAKCNFGISKPIGLTNQI